MIFTDKDITDLLDINAHVAKMLCATPHAPLAPFHSSFQKLGRQFFGEDQNNQLSFQFLFALEKEIHLYGSPADQEAVLKDLIPFKAKILDHYLVEIEGYINWQDKVITNQHTKTKVEAFKKDINEIRASKDKVDYFTLLALKEAVQRHVSDLKSVDNANIFTKLMGKSPTHNYFEKMQDLSLLLRSLYTEHEEIYAPRPSTLPLVTPFTQLPVPFTAEDVQQLQAWNIEGLKVAFLLYANPDEQSIAYRDANASQYHLGFIENLIAHVEQQNKKYPNQALNFDTKALHNKLLNAKLYQYIDACINTIEEHREVFTNPQLTPFLKEFLTNLQTLKAEYRANENSLTSMRDYFLRLSRVNLLVETGLDLFKQDQAHLHHTSSGVRQLFGASKTTNFANAMQAHTRLMESELFSIKLTPADAIFNVSSDERARIDELAKNYDDVLRKRRQDRRNHVVTTSMFHHDKLTALNKQIQDEVVNAAKVAAVPSLDEQAGFHMFVRNEEKRINNLREQYKDCSNNTNNLRDISQFGLVFSMFTLGIGAPIAAVVVGIAAVETGVVALVKQIIAPGKGELLKQLQTASEKIKTQLQSAFWPNHKAPAPLSTKLTKVEFR